MENVIKAINIKGVDMTKEELEVLEKLLWKEMSMYGAISKTEHECDCLMTVWKMVKDYREEEG